MQQTLYSGMHHGNKFFHDGLHLKIMSVYYSEVEFIFFSARDIANEIGVPKSSTRRAIRELYANNCVSITTKENGKPVRYTIREENMAQFSRLVVNDPKKHRAKIINRNRVIMNEERYGKIICKRCKKTFTTLGFNNHKGVCKKKV